MRTFIYKITNRKNNKIYIGITSNQNPKNRWAKHIQIARNKNTHPLQYSLIHRAINKHGKENFIFEVIEECENQDVGFLREKFWIKYYNTFKSDIGYNLTEGGDGAPGNKQSEETRIKRGQSLKNYYKQNGHPLVGRQRSRKTKLKISQANKGKIRKGIKLQASDIPIIRKLYADGMTPISIAHIYGVTPTTIREIIRGEKWATA